MGRKSAAPSPSIGTLPGDQNWDDDSDDIAGPGRFVEEQPAGVVDQAPPTEDGFPGDAIEAEDWDGPDDEPQAAGRGEKALYWETATDSHPAEVVRADVEGRATLLIRWPSGDLEARENVPHGPAAGHWTTPDDPLPRPEVPTADGREVVVGGEVIYVTNEVESDLGGRVRRIRGHSGRIARVREGNGVPGSVPAVDLLIDGESEPVNSLEYKAWGRGWAWTDTELPADRDGSESRLSQFRSSRSGERLAEDQVVGLYLDSPGGTPLVNSRDRVVPSLHDPIARVSVAELHELLAWLNAEYRPRQPLAG